LPEEVLEIEKIIADRKVFEYGVDDYKNQIRAGKDVGVITVIKHPKRDLYAVLDGHHRFWAHKSLGTSLIKCVVIQDFIGPLFFFTKEGYLQPTALFTKHIRIPFKRVKQFLEDFIKDPDKLKAL
jgi:hypothetical protein